PTRGAPRRSDSGNEGSPGATSPDSQSSIRGFPDLDVGRCQGATVVWVGALPSPISLFANHGVSADDNSRLPLLEKMSSNFRTAVRGESAHCDGKYGCVAASSMVY